MVKNKWIILLYIKKCNIKDQLIPVLSDMPRYHSSRNNIEASMIYLKISLKNL